MFESVNLFLFKWRYFYFGFLLILASMLLLSFLLASVASGSPQDTKGNNTVGVPINESDNPNTITAGAFKIADGLEKSINSAEDMANNTMQAAGEAVSQSGNLIAQGTKSIASGTAGASKATLSGAGSLVGTVGSASGSFAGGIGEGVGYIANLPGKALGTISNSDIITSAIQPADHAEVPIIDPNSPALQEARVAMGKPEPDPLSPQADTLSAWPIHGEITAAFGESHLPYQVTHSGIDISDGRPSGVTPVKPFKSGRVIEAGKSSQGLGNHVVIDHGSGVTSVYGHLSSVSVQAGQAADKNTNLGFQGSTGVSTGPHVHFEIRVNGLAADPRHFIDGRP